MQESAVVEALEKRSGYPGRLDEQPALYAKPKLLLVDERGSLPLENSAEERFFQLVSRRYECGSMLMTSNRAVREGGMVFGDALVATAILDRLFNHGTVLTLFGERFRSREKHRMEQARRCDAQEDDLV
jgi:DNA replication protein DnaC